MSKIKIAYFSGDTTKDTVLTRNGRALDNHCISCKTEEDCTTGNYLLDATFLLEDDLHDLLNEEDILKVQMDYGCEVFRISKITITTRYIYVVARQITIADSLTLWIEDVRPQRLNGQEAMDRLLEGATGVKEINLFSDITDEATAYFYRMSLYNALHDSDQSFLTRWGGEVLRRGYDLRINAKIGEDRGFTIREGKNLTGFEATSNLDNLVTRARGQGYNGILGDYIDSPIINSYSRVYTGIIKYDDVKVKENKDDDGFETVAEAQAELNRRIREEFSKNNIDKIKAVYTVNFIQLEKTEEYKYYQQAEELLIGDICRVYIPNLDIDIDVRAVSKKYDVLAQRVEEIKLSMYLEANPLSLRRMAEKVANADNEIINTRLLNKIYYFDTVEEMKKFRLLINGDHAKTLGYYEVGDGGGAYYNIGTTQRGEWSIDVGGGLYANIHELEEVNYKQFGAILDGVNDDSQAMINCHKYADSIRYSDNNGKTFNYLCTVRNNRGIIYKKNTEPIICSGNVDLAGSTLILDDTNASWYGLYLWGDVNSLYWDYEIAPDMKLGFKADKYHIALPSNDELPPNTVLKLDETPYTVRDDAGYLYSVGRKELILHDRDGIITSPFADDWDYSGGEEINCKVTDLNTGEPRNEKSYSVLTSSYTYIPSQKGFFIGCDVILRPSADKYSSVLTVYRHNSEVKNFNFIPDDKTLHNLAYNNSMIYVRDSFNVTLSNIQGFNKSGKAENGVKATSGYMVRATNCSNIILKDCKLQGYWGATAMDSVKNVYLYRCHINRFDTHDYCYNVYARDCVFYQHSIQLGYGRGSANFTNCDFYYNDIPNNSYPEAYCIALNLTYGRIFEGVITLENCNVRVSGLPENYFSIIAMYFSPEATSITKHFKFPQLHFRNINIFSDDDNVNLDYVSIGGQRLARTGLVAPTHVNAEIEDGTVRWKYVGRAFNYGIDTGRSLKVNIGDVVKVVNSFINEESKTQFYDERYYQCISGGEMVYSSTIPQNNHEITIGTALFEKIYEPLWESNKDYNVGDRIIVKQSNFYEPYIYQCIKSGKSDGLRPTHTSGTVLEAYSTDVIVEQDSCWWTYVGDSSMFKEFTPNFHFLKGQYIKAEGRLYEVIEPIYTTNMYPFENGWLKDFNYGGGVLRYIGNVWEPSKWFIVGSYCMTENRVYRLDKHSGITSGVKPVVANPYAVDGDISWEHKGTIYNWKANMSVKDIDYLNANFRLYQVIHSEDEGGAITDDMITGAYSPSVSGVAVGSIIMDGTLPVKYWGTHPNQWRVQGATYNVGDIIFDNTWVCICEQGGTTGTSKWGCLEGASGWNADGTYKDGEIIWRALTPTSSDGYWRNGKKHYDEGAILLVNDGNGNNIVTQVTVLGSNTGSTIPTDRTPDKDIIDGGATLRYLGDIKGWTANTRYNEGDYIGVEGRLYYCAFDGRMTLPDISKFEGITTNIKNVSVFRFFSTMDVPVKKGVKDWKVIVRDCEYTTEERGLGGRYYFGNDTNLNPTFVQENIIKDVETSLDAIYDQLGAINNQLENKVEADDITTAINNIKIGGRNLIRDTKNSWTDISVGRYVGYIEGSKRVPIEEYGLKHGDTVTFSVELQAINKPIRARISLYEDETGNSYSSKYGNTIPIGSNGLSTVTMTIPDTGNYLVVYIANNNTSDTTSTIEKYRYPKLERGNKATDWTPAPEDIDDKIDNIEIGGQNLLRYEDINIYSSNFGENYKLDKNNYLKDGTVITRGANLTNLGFYVTNYSRMESNTEYVISFYLKELRQGCVKEICVYRTILESSGAVATKNNTGIYMDNNFIGRFDEIIPISMSDGKYHKFELKFKTVENLDFTNRTYDGLILQVNKSQTAPTEIQFRGLMWQKGNEPTGWSPNPDEVDSKIDSKIDNKIDNIEIGGRNLITGTSDKWVDFNVSRWASSPKQFDISTLGIKVGDELTYSIYLKSINKPLRARVTFNKSDGTTQTIYGKDTVEISNEGKCCITFTVPELTTRIILYIQNNNTDTYTTETTEQYRGLKLEYGNKATDWSPSPEDTDNKITKLEQRIAQLEALITSLTNN